ncbi:MAG: sensor domain-containing diguanylate cyclase [Tepidibacter sp.]|jgi:diguanylate cyclase (GGDEF)-like protein|uniref:sensor domain-containing diguanylate cyclase n=1 Tax=Tepidibacter sp. TaxID=2529387 RepID=UPI0025E69672|nr:sensor domain-containing diguanylate cyclase [Tepidibacter sp.]MCT4509165.1 sensor domain-containing diguanylate cyclase [Tepidibacter sp.]
MLNKLKDSIESEKIKIISDELRIENVNLRKELQESKAANWILSQVIKACGTVNSFEALMENITDILMGVLGVDTCSIWIKSDNIGKYTSYSRSVYNSNEYEIERYDDFPDDILEIKDTKTLDINNEKFSFCKWENVNSILISSLEDVRTNRERGVIILEHRNKNFFSENTKQFFDILSIQLSIAAVNSKMFEKINEITNKDPLTKCHNRKYLEKIISENLSGREYTLAVFDLDNFKMINDLFGHKKGDDVLVRVSKLARTIVEDNEGELIRIGGDEFVIILYKTIEESVRILEKLRKGVPDLHTIKDTGIDITMTIGVACSKLVDGVDKIFNLADMALIEGKKNNCKNKIHIASY